jgi:DNA-binding MarR family transcriptional regulator
MKATPSAARRRRLDEIAEALPERAAMLSRLFFRRATVPITRTEFGVLHAVQERPRRITELTAHVGVTQPAITLLVNRLEDRGWVHRGTDPSDRRVVLVCLTEAGAQTIDGLRAEYRALLHEEMASLDDHEVETLGRAIDILDGLIARLEEHRG